MKRQLFKYHKANDHLYELLINNRLYCCERLKLNDPHDGLFSISEDLKNRHAKEAIEKHSSYNKNIQVTPELIEEIKKSISNKDLYEQLHFTNNGNNFRICSFSEDGKNELMWAHYSENFNGVCLKFEFEENDPIFNQLFKVEYSDDLPELKDLKLQSILSAYKIKRKAWEYEKEWRIINDHDFIQFNKTNLREIYFGIWTEKSKIDSIRKMCSELGYPDIVFKKINIKIKDEIIK